MVIENLDFITLGTSMIQGGGVKNNFPCFPKASAFGRIDAVAAGIQAKLLSCVQTAAIVNHKKIEAAVTYKLSLCAKS